MLFVIPLGVLAASDAARVGRRGWLALFIALIIIAPFAAWINALTNNIQNALFMSCQSDVCSTAGPVGAPWLVTQIGWVVAFLPVPIAALAYSFLPAQNPAALALAEGAKGGRRTLIVCAIAGIALMSALGYLGAARYLLVLFGRGSFTQIMAVVTLQSLLYTLWIMLAAAPVAIASVALAHSAQEGRRAWLAGWIALVLLALLTANLGSSWAFILILHAEGVMSGSIPNQLITAGVVAPVAIMLIALIYALVVMRPEPQAGALAAAESSLPTASAYPCAPHHRTVTSNGAVCGGCLARAIVASMCQSLAIANFGYAPALQMNLRNFALMR